MNSFTLIGIGNLARNPEVTAKGNVAYVRFCLVGNDRAESDEQVDHPHEVVTSAWFMAFDEIADNIARNARKGDQLIVTARVRPYIHIDKQGEKRCENVLIVTGFRYRAKKRGPGSSAPSVIEPPPTDPCQPTAETLAMSA